MILKGDCIEVMKAIKPNSVDAIVTDPPYGIGFMGKEWDNFKPSFIQRKMDADKRPKTQIASQRRSNAAGTYDMSLRGKQGFYDWICRVSKEMLKVLKPGGSLLICGGTRTSHRLACAIEDSGFIIKDTLMWLYGSGFPKAQDLGKMIDKRNGRKAKDFKQLGDYLKEQRLKKGLNTNDIGKNFPSKSGGITGCFRNWEYGNNVPTMKQWGVLKELLNLNGNFDWLIKREEAERKVLGRDKNWSEKKGSVPFMNYGEWKITAPSTDLAKHWDGFKVGGIKPAYEPIIWAVKPPEGSYVDNVLKWGVGAVNVDECRIGLQEHGEDKRLGGKGDWSIDKTATNAYGEYAGKGRIGTSPKGRFPANVILSHHPECVQVGMKRVKGNSQEVSDDITGLKPFHDRLPNKGRSSGYAKDGLETVESWDCHPDCAVFILDQQSGNLKSGGQSLNTGMNKGSQINIGGGRIQCSYSGDNGGASRFFYCAKASRGERNAGLDGMEKRKKHTSSGDDHVINEICPYHHITLCKCGWRSKAVSNFHPTVKPIKLFEYLIKLVTREGQIVLDPFMGSGTTAIAAHNIGRKCVGIEKEDEYLTIAKRRIDYWQSQPKQMEIGI